MYWFYAKKTPSTRSGTLGNIPEIIGIRYRTMCNRESEFFLQKERVVPTLILSPGKLFPPGRWWNSVPDEFRTDVVDNPRLVAGPCSPRSSRVDWVCQNDPLLNIRDMLNSGSFMPIKWLMVTFCWLQQLPQRVQVGVLGDGYCTIDGVPLASQNCWDLLENSTGLSASDLRTSVAMLLDSGRSDVDAWMTLPLVASTVKIFLMILSLSNCLTTLSSALLAMWIARNSPPVLFNILKK